MNNSKAIEIKKADISRAIYSMDTIQLEAMDQVKLMNRTDTKYWFHKNRLEELLQEIRRDYFILKINGESELPYSTTYFDTHNNQMFVDHHKGKLNRYKVRKRAYVSSGISFLEVKFKNNKGRTIKKRIPSEFGHSEFTANELDFINQETPFKSADLHPSLLNNFSRLTLVNKNFKERCTIDINLRFELNNRKIALDNMVIVEIKAEGKSNHSLLAKALRNQRIKTSGFSKYAIGSTVTNSNLKRNAFKRKIRNIEKIIYSNNNLYYFN